MKKTKTLATAFAVAFFASALFAQAEQNASPKSHLQKAKECISQKKWVSALGECYDSVLSDSAEDAEEAYNSWTEISEAIKDGKPGLGEFDDFSIVDNWILALQDYERYWTNNCPFTIYFDKPERTELNREKKTADYRLRIKLKEEPKYFSNKKYNIYTQKFKEIDKIINKGFSAAYKKDWQMDYLSNWNNSSDHYRSFISVYENGKNNEKYLVNDVALISRCAVRKNYTDGNLYDDTTYASEQFCNKHRINPFCFKYQFGKQLAAFVDIPIWKSGEVFHLPYDVWNFYEAGFASLYEIKFSIRDNTGNILYQSNKHHICIFKDDYNFYEMKNISQKAMELIETNEVKFVVDELSLKYGKINNLVMAEDLSWLNKLPEIKVEGFCSKTWNETDVEPKALSEIAEERKAEEDKKQFYYSLLSNQLSYLSYHINISLAKILEIKGDKKNPLSFKIIEYQEPSIHPDLLEKYSEDEIKKTFFYLFCNGINNRKCYFVDDSSVSESSYKNEAEFFLENFEKIKESPSNDDWRLPTKEEIEYVSSLRLKANKKSKLATISNEAILNGNFLIKKY